MAKPIVVKNKVDVVKIRKGDKKIKTKLRKLPKKPAKVSPTRKILTPEEKKELNNLYKLVELSRQTIHGKLLYTAYDTGLRSHAKLQITCLAGSHVSFDLTNPRSRFCMLTDNLTDLRNLEKAIKKARKYIEAQRKIQEVHNKIQEPKT